MSVIKAGTTLTTAYTVEADTTGALEFKTGPSATLAMSISASGVVTFPATTGFDIASANITNLTSRSLTVSAATYLATASGVVGIGTTNPSATVGIVDGANNANGQLRLSNSGSFGTRMGFVSTSTNGRTYQIGSNFVDGNGEFAIYDATASVSRFWINASGNVGINVVPKAWSTGISAIQFGNKGALISNDSVASYGLNSFYDGADKYIGNGPAGDHLISGSRHLIRSASSGTASSALTWTNVLDIDKGKSLALEGASSQSGTGITFPATQSASSDANTLDDYEEGTWTPTGNGITFASAVGKYTKIGDTVTVWWQIEFPSTASAGDAAISGLPFTVASGTWSGAISITNVGIADVLAFAHSERTVIYHRNSSNVDYTNANFSTKFSYGWSTYKV